MKQFFLLALLIVSALGFAQGNALAQTTTTYSNGSPDRGWEGLARALDAVTPSVNTDNPLSGEQINRQIASLINRGQTDAALQEISQRETLLAQNTAPGRDVQLMFQKARALAQSGRLAQAEQIYRDMTIQYPELAEPWNNLALIYIQRNDLDQALLALQAAVMNNPRYPAALTNLADLRLLMALRDYQQAAGMGAREAKARAAALEQFIQSRNTPPATGR